MSLRFTLPKLGLLPFSVRFLRASGLVVVAFLGSTLANADEPPALDPKDKLIVETVLRLQDFDLESSAKAKAAMLRFLRAQPGSQQYFELIDRFQPLEIADDLTEYCLLHADETGGVRGAELLFRMKQEGKLSALVEGEDASRAALATTLIGRAAGKRSVDILLPIIKNDTITAGARAAAVAALGRRDEGQREILRLVEGGELAQDLKFAAANALLSSENRAIVEEASKYLELPATADSKPLPTLAELVKRHGDVSSGAKLFQTIGTCNKCHKVLGEGKEVGPDLSEIGSKLSREAMYVSILDPSAAVSHNYETFTVLTDEGEVLTGLLLSDTDTAVTIRTAEGIDRTIDKEYVEVVKKQPQSLMPQDLQRLLTADQLVDVVEYAMTLQKRE